MKTKTLILIACLSFSTGAFSQEKKGETVVLLHGLARTHRSMRPLEKHLRREGYDVLNLRYPSRQKTISYLSETWLPEALNTQIKNPEQKIHFVAHSLGAIVVRAYLQNHALKNLGRIVMLSPPNQGSQLAEKMKNFFLFKWVMGPAGQELGIGDNSVPLTLKPIEAEIGVITGDRSLNFLFSYWIKGQDDGKVAVDEAKLSGMKDFIVVHRAHWSIMRSKKVRKQVVSFLETGSFLK